MLVFLRAPPVITLRLHGRRGIGSYANSPGSEDLMVPTLKRWLYGDRIQAKIRQLDFDVEALKDVATRVSGATCTDIRTTHEGLYNRIFALKFEGRRDDLVARIPFRSAGPVGLLTKSEVATMDFVRTKVGAPIPKVLAWDPSPYNPVGCEYIIMEKCPGVSLAEKLPGASDASLFVTDMARWMADLASVQFSQFGSIYYKEDVDVSLQARPLYADGEEADACSERFRIGPSVERTFYRYERANMAFDRGPWPDAHSYIRAFAECEVQWMKEYPKDIKTQRHVGPRHGVERYISTLNDWLSTIPALLPPVELTRPALSHPNLDSSDIFIDDPVLWNNSGIIGWQSATIRPLCFTRLPDFVVFDANNFKYSKSSSLPDNFDQLEAHEQAQAQDEFSRIMSRRRFYIVMTELAPDLFEACVKHNLLANTIKQASRLASHVWSIGLPLLEYELMKMADAYGNPIPKHPKYSNLPVKFSADDKKRITKHLEDIHTEQRILNDISSALKTKGIEVGFDGSVRAEDYFPALEESKIIHKHIQGKLGKRDKNVFRVLWPLRSGKFAINQETCM